MTRKVIIEYDRGGWKALYPSGQVRRWQYRNNSFMGWVMSFLRQDGDVVEVKYPKTVSTYTMRSRPRE